MEEWEKAMLEGFPDAHKVTNDAERMFFKLGYLAGQLAHSKLMQKMLADINLTEAK